MKSVVIGDSVLAKATIKELLTNGMQAIQISVTPELLDWQKTAEKLKKSRNVFVCIEGNLTEAEKTKKIMENIKNACEINKSNLFYASSNIVYNCFNKNAGESNAKPETRTGKTFLSIEKKLNDPMFFNSRNVTVFRLPLVFGPGKTSTLLQKSIAKAVSGEKIVWPFNLGKEIETAFSEDIAKNIVEAMKKKENGFYCYNYGLTTRMKAIDFFKEFFRQSKQALNIETENPFLLSISTVFNNKKKVLLENRHLYENPPKIKTERFYKDFSFTKKTVFREAVQKTIKGIQIEKNK